MANIDLIPESYRHYVRVRRTLLQAGWALALVLICAIGALSALQWQVRVDDRHMVALREKAAEVATLRQQVDSMKETQARNAQMARTMAALHGDGEVALAIDAMDQSLNEGVWLTQVRFERLRRASEAPLPEEVDTVQGGQFVTTAFDGADSKKPGLMLSTRLDIKGTAVDHSALADFINGLSRQQRIADVRLLNSHIKASAVTPAVEFSADVIIKPRKDQL